MSRPLFVLAGIDATIADQLRARGGTAVIADEYPGYPCRQCLTDAAIGDELILVSHDPFRTTSPYRSASPIFLHRVRCSPDVSDELPAQLTRRTLSVRAFDADEMMLDAALIDGPDLHATIDRLLEDSAVDHLHVHNEPRGCWAARVDRLASPSSQPHRAGNHPG